MSGAARRPLGLVVVVALAAGCGVPVFDPGAPPLEPTPAPLSIAGTQEDLVFSRADDEDPLTDGIQTTLRVDVSDELIERVDLVVSAPTGQQTLDDVVAEDLDGVRCARFVVTVAAELPVRATTPDLPPTAVMDARATLLLAAE